MARPHPGVGLPRKVTTNMAYQHLPMSFTSNHFTGHQHEPPHLLSLLTRHILSSRFFSPSLPLLGQQGCATVAKTGLCRVRGEKEMFRRAFKSCSFSMLAYPSEWMRIRVAICGSDTSTSNLFPPLANPPRSNPSPVFPPCGFLPYLWRAQGGKHCQGFLYAGPHLHDGGLVGPSNSPARTLLILPRYEVELPISLSPVSLSSDYLVPLHRSLLHY